MSVRERMLAMVVLGFIVLAGAVLMIQQFIWRPLRSRDDRISAVKSEIDEKRTKIAQIEAQKPKFEVWRRLSLPADLNFARLEYEKYLRELLRQSGFERQTGNVERTSPTVIPKPADTKTGPTLPGKKEPIYTRLTFSVVAHGELADLVDFLERFYRTPLLHEIKKLDIHRPLTPSVGAGPQQRTNDLDVDMTIEVLVLSGADKRNQLLPAVDWKLAAVDVVTDLCNGPTGLMVIPWAVGPTGPLGPGILASSSRQYGSIAAKDIFFGPKEVQQDTEQVLDKIETTENVYLTDITHTGNKVEAFFYVQYDNSKTRLRPTTGFDSFRIRNGKGVTLAQGKVVRIDERDLIFRSGEKYYSIHVGQNLQEALKHPLDASQLKELGLNGSTSNGSTSNGSGK
jgi:hypothetical protein